MTSWQDYPCIHGEGHVREDGYITRWIDGRHVRVHRLAYVEAFGPIPGNLPLDHLCRHPWCAQPHHLEPVTIAENTMRGQAPNVLLHHAGVCSRGHDQTLSDNTYTERRSNGRLRTRCRICQRIRNRTAVAA